VSIAFVDTYYWVALANRNDAAHARVTEFARQYSDQTLTTEWILTEVADGLSHSRHRRLVAHLEQLWRTDPALTIVEASHALFERGLELYCNRMDKEWSLTDCISFVVMQEHGLTDALTADHHFEQAGFVALLK
jgi:predicted nucleic acid-binding protein